MHASDNLLRALAEWIADGGREGTVTVAGRVGRGDACERWSVTALLYELADSTDTLPPGLAGTLGLPSPSTFGHVARILWVLLHDRAVAADSARGAARALRTLPPEERARRYEAATWALRCEHGMAVAPA